MPNPYARNPFSGLLDEPATATATAAPIRLSGEQAYKMLEDKMTGQATSIEQQENNRYSQGLSTLQGAYGQSQSALSNLLDPDLLFSQASDPIGAQAGGQMDALRRSLGARGLNPNSGAASSLLSRIVFGKQQALQGARLSSEVENVKLRQTAAAQNFANALNLAGYVNSPVSQIGLDTTQNQYEGLLAREGLHNARQSQKDANKTNFASGLLGAGSSILSSLIPGL